MKISPDRVISTLKQIKHRLFIIRQNINIIYQAVSIRLSPSFHRKYRSLESTFEIPELPRVEGIWGIAMVKNEADIIELSLRHMANQGVDHLLVVDNGSTDGTLEILTELAQDLPLTVGLDKEPAYYQSEKMTWLADRAREHGASWVVPFDADEFWYGCSGQLADVLSEVSSSICQAQIFNQFPQLDGSWSLDTEAHTEVKVCFRPSRLAVIGMGNHYVLLPSKICRGKIGILHRPWRSFKQFERKVGQGASSLELTDLPAHLGYHWRTLGQATQAELETLWGKLISGLEIEEPIAWKPSKALIPLAESLPDCWESLPLQDQSL